MEPFKSAVAKFILESCFWQTLNKTWPNSAFATEEAMRKLADDGRNKLGYVGDVKKS